MFNYHFNYYYVIGVFHCLFASVFKCVKYLLVIPKVLNFVFMLNTAALVIVMACLALNGMYISNTTNNLIILFIGLYLEQSARPEKPYLLIPCFNGFDNVHLFLCTRFRFYEYKLFLNPTFFGYSL